MILIPFDAERNCARLFHGLLIFLGSDRPDPSEIDDSYGRWCESNPAPAQVLVVGHGNVVEGLARDTGWQQKMLLKGTKVQLGDMHWDGRVAEVGGVAGADLSTTFESAAWCYVANRIDDGELVIPAPAGFYFEKLSQRKSTHFLKAEALLESTDHIELLARAILPRFHRWVEANRSLLQLYVYVDTMGIWPLADRLCRLHAEGNPEQEQRYAVKSFSSYGGLEDWQPIEVNSFVVISASTSDKLLHKVFEKIPGKNVGNVTLLSLRPESFDDDPEKEQKHLDACFYSVSRTLGDKSSLGGLRAEFQPDLSLIPTGADTIKIVGERFVSQHVKPRLVRIIGSVLDAPIKRRLHLIANADLMRVAVRKSNGKGLYALFPEMKTLVDSAVEQANGEHLHTLLKNYAPAGPITLVHPAGHGSAPEAYGEQALRLAKAAAKILEGGGQTATVISSNDLLALPPNSVTDGIIVIAPVIGDGFFFKSVSADLRLCQPKGARLFLALFAMPQSHGLSELLRRDLELRTPDSVYRLYLDVCLPTGKLDDDVMDWEKERGILNAVRETAEKTNVTLPEAFVSRLDALNEGRCLAANQVFLPDATGNPLKLTPGFALWPDGCEIGEPLQRYSAAVLLTVSVTLQSARERSRTNHETSLFSGQFAQTVLGPAETFTRYNDSVIQAAFLRAAYPAELDYRAIEHASRDVARLIEKWIGLAAYASGAAVPEFLLALKTEKLRLRPPEMKLIGEAVASLSGWVKILADQIKWTD